MLFVKCINIIDRGKYMLIYDRLKLIRKHFGLSQSQFAQKINRSPGFLSNVETGRSEISESTVHSVCTAFGINETWLVSGNGEMFADGREVAEADKDTIGPRIRKLRKDHNLTQEQFGKATGYSKVHIHYIEAGKVTPSNAMLKRVSDAFHVSYEWLLTGEGEVERNPEEAVVDDELIEWLKKNPEIVKELRIRGGLD